MPQVLENSSAVSADVLKVEHYSSEPFDVPVAPTMDTVFTPGMVAAIDTNGHAVVGDGKLIAIGLFVSPSTPTGSAKNNYVEASGNASIISGGILILTDSIADAAIAPGAKLYADANGKLSKAPVNGASPVLAIALTARTTVEQSVRIKLSV